MIQCGLSFIKILRLLLVNNFYLYADENSLFEIVSNEQKVLLVGSDFGYGNFGDVAQLKGTIDFYKENSSLTPIVVYHVNSISNANLIEKRKKQLNVKSILFISDNYLSFSEKFSLYLIEEAQNFSLIHLYGGGFLNSMWGDYILNIVEFFIDNLKLKNYIISGQQIEDKIIPRLIDHVSKYQPAFFGVRDYDSLTYLESAGIEGIYSFDDAFEQLFKIAQKVDNKKQNRILAHFNISSYTGSEDKLFYFNNLLSELKMYDNTKLTMFNAYDDKRFEVSDTISVLKEFEDEFVYESYEVVHGTKLLYDTYNDESYNCLSVKLAISSSYHTTMLMQLCGTPCWLISNNSYYDQKREALEVRQTFQEFIKEPFLPSFDDRIQKRITFYTKLHEFLNNLPELTLKIYFSYIEKDAFKFSFKVNLVNEKGCIQELIKTKDWLLSDNENKEQYIQELIKTKEYLLSEEIKYNEIKKTLFYKIGRKLGFFTDKN